MIDRRGRYILDLIRSLMLVAAIVCAALVILRVALDINLVTLVALPTVATAVIGVALKDTLARFFACVALGKGAGRSGFGGGGSAPESSAAGVGGGVSGIRHRYKLRFSLSDYARHLSIASHVRSYVWNAFRRQGIAIPLPQRVVHHESRAEAPTDRMLTISRLAETLRAVEMLACLSQEQLAQGNALERCRC